MGLLFQGSAGSCGDGGGGVAAALLLPSAKEESPGVDGMRGIADVDAVGREVDRVISSGRVIWMDGPGCAGWDVLDWVVTLEGGGSGMLGPEEAMLGFALVVLGLLMVCLGGS